MPSIRHKVDVSFEDGRIAVRPGGGVLFSFPIAGNPRLENATPEQLVHVEVDETGMHWPDIDEDLSLAAIRKADLLLSWNCRHIANSATIPKVAATLAVAGYACPAIATPEQRLEERIDE